MRVQLDVSEKYYKEIEDKLKAADFELDDDGEFLFSEKDRFASDFILKDGRGEKVQVSADDIVFIESIGHDIIVHTAEEKYMSAIPLYRFCMVLDENRFARVSNCAIIAKTQIKKIRPALSMKFVLTMSEGSLVDVTRSYYSAFRIFMGI